MVTHLINIDNGKLVGTNSDLIFNLPIGKRRGKDKFFEAHQFFGSKESTFALSN